MRRFNVSISIDESTIREIKSIYGKSDYPLIVAIVEDILWRYLSIEYFDPELYDPDCPNDDDGYAMCERCREKSKKHKMIDVDGVNLEEHWVCDNCGNGYPALR